MSRQVIIRAWAVEDLRTGFGYIGKTTSKKLFNFYNPLNRPSMILRKCLVWAKDGQLRAGNGRFAAVADE